MLGQSHQPGRRAWVVVGMLFLFSTINYFDKLVLGLAAVPIMKELGLSPASYGLVAGSFFWLYAISGVLTGIFLVNRISTKWLLAGLVAIWSLSQLPIALTSSLSILVACRIVLGIGEGPGTPTAYHACHAWFESDKRNLPTAIVLQGVAFGFLIGAPILTHVILEYGWRTAFLTCSGLGFCWIVVWLLVGADGPISVNPAAAGAVADSHRVAWATLWFDRSMLGNYVLGFGAYWMAGLSIAWLAPYFQLGLGYDGRTVGWIISAMSACQIVTMLTISYGSQQMLQAGMSSRLSRAWMNAACVVLGGIGLTLSLSFESGVMKIALIAIGFMLPNITFILGPAMVSEVAPTGQRGTALLVTYSVITIAGLFSPMVMGQIIQQAGPLAVAQGYATALYASSALLIVCGIIGFVLLRPDETVRRFKAGLASNPAPAAGLSSRPA